MQQRLVEPFNIITENLEYTVERNLYFIAMQLTESLTDGRRCWVRNVQLWNMVKIKDLRMRN